MFKPAALATFIFLLASSTKANSSQRDPACLQVERSISRASAVFYPGDAEYIKGIDHWANSSAQASKCVVEPGSATDVGVILRAVAKFKTPFAIKGGGHATNPGFSSTPGVQITMSRFNKVEYDPSSQTVDVGPGLLWDDVYQTLDKVNRTVVGGRVSGVGVAGLTLGGGYSWLTNQHGLAVDNVVAYELVKPNGQVIVVTKASYPALFFGLKGGYNNFGVVTKFTFKTYPSPGVWGGFMFIGEDGIDANTAAVADFSANVTDPKAAIISNYIYTSGALIMSQILFYDGATPPPGIFDNLLAVPSFERDISTRNITSLVQATPSTPGLRALFHTVPLLDFSPNILNVIRNESNFWGQQLTPKSSSIISYAIEPFVPGIYTHTNDKSAFPFTRSSNFLPLNLFFSWVSEESDADFLAAIKASGKVIFDAAIAEGQQIADAPEYPNYALFDTPITQIYGSNLPALKSLKTQVDPQNVMGLAGGYKF